MRIKRHDIPAKVYTSNKTVDAEGVAQNTWVFLHDVSLDFQPIKSSSKLAEYGLEPGEGMTGFADLLSDFPLNSVSLIKGQNWQVLGVAEWYNHVEIIFKRYQGLIGD